MFRITSPNYSDYVLKVYHKEKLTPERLKKTIYLKNNPPIAIQPGVHAPLIWITELAYNKNGFIGFIMPMAKGEKLEILCTSKLHRKYQKAWARFDLRRPEALKLRLKICYNIATAIYQAHQTNKYVIVDLKPDNIIIQPNGFVSIVDMDSVEVIENNKTLFHANVATPEYAPPEFSHELKAIQSTFIPETWDRFSMAIIFYKLLFGIHPYAGSAKPPYDKYTALHQKIAHGLFPFSPSKTEVFKMIPPPHQRFQKIPLHIQQLFIRCFENGHKNTLQRPSAHEWCWSIIPQNRLVVNRPLPSVLGQLSDVAFSESLNLSTHHQSGINNVALQPYTPPDVTYFPFTTNFFAISRIFAFVSVAIIVLTLILFPFDLVSLAQYASLLFANLLVSTIEYYSLPIVDEKAKAIATKQEVAIIRQKQLYKVNQLGLKRKEVLGLFEGQHQNFNQIQNLILNDEKSKIQILINNHHRTLEELNKKARELTQEEMTILQTREKEVLGKIGKHHILKNAQYLPTDKKIEWLNDEVERQFANIEIDAQQQIAEAQLSLTNLEAIIRDDINNDFNKQHQQDLKTLHFLENRRVTVTQEIVHNYNESLNLILSNYRIPSRKLFTLAAFTINRNLVAVNIRTAGDFVGYEKGRILFADGTSKIIPGLDNKRGKILTAWRENLIKTLSNLPAYPKDKIEEIQTSINTQIHALKNRIEENTLLNEMTQAKIPAKIEMRKLEIKKEIETIKTNLATRKANVKQEIASIKDELIASDTVFEQFKTEIKEMFDEKHEKLSKEGEIAKTTLIQKIATIKKATKDKINTEFQLVSENQKNELTALQQSIEEINQETALLHEYHHTFVEKSKDLLFYKKITLSNYLKKIFLFKN